ncbi:uncharacterized protein TRAVEDRAFT_49969 [Trametes versicolor FP-101664 SS1]|uniref:uncharacterized protein n=1 Tax=Trametes versicolor (strain FP-101664) TaxID=717944 RepID=UPI0004623B85|nr:uncharacterized protein TRAVEDRAFT_49969 [Trametes versicolor FP-101664 SS1]EIW55479.1 hypothetical protein TRAVEDRAFT_49969 [Trametes versicolor FP-101664 SS1]
MSRMTQVTLVLRFNLGKALTLSLYLTMRPGPTATNVSAYTVTSTAPWKVIAMPATGLSTGGRPLALRIGTFLDEQTWDSNTQFDQTSTQVASSGLTYIPIEVGQVITLTLAPNQPQSGQLTYFFTEPVASRSAALKFKRSTIWGAL